jgi:hypothetical protein
MSHEEHRTLPRPFNLLIERSLIQLFFALASSQMSGDSDVSLKNREANASHGEERTLS